MDGRIARFDDSRSRGKLDSGLSALLLQAREQCFTDVDRSLRAQGEGYGVAGAAIDGRALIAIGEVEHGIIGFPAHILDGDAVYADLNFVEDGADEIVSQRPRSALILQPHADGGRLGDSHPDEYGAPPPALSQDNDRISLPVEGNGFDCKLDLLRCHPFAAPGAACLKQAYSALA